MCAGRIAVPINTAYKGAYLTHQLTDSGSRVIVVAASYLDRVAAIAQDVPTLEHVIVVDDVDAGDDEDAGAGAPSPAAVPSLGRVTVHRWDDIMAAAGRAPTVDVRPSDLATFIYTGGTTGLSKGCMLTHNYHEALARQIGLCWKRTADDVAWTPLPMYHFNALVTAVVGTLLFGGRGAIFRRFSVSQFWPEMNRVGRHRHLDARDDGVPAGPRRRPTRDARARARPRPTAPCA